ncbi:putative Late embryogenesis abundant protein, LEA_1 subgroup [Helianthus anomalus]
MWMGEKMTTAHDPMQKEMAREKKEERKHEAEFEKQAGKSTTLRRNRQPELIATRPPMLPAIAQAPAGFKLTGRKDVFLDGFLMELCFICLWVAVF